MRLRLVVSVPLLVALLVPMLVLPGLASAEQTRYVFNTKLTGAAERPGPGDPDAKGKAQLKIDLETGMICYRLRVKDIDGTLTGAHIHVITLANGSGPVVQGLAVPTSGRSSGCVSNPTLAANIIANPSIYYVNVHSNIFPAGAVRGDLR